MHRILQVVAWSYAVACAIVWTISLRPMPRPAAEPHMATPIAAPIANTAESWFTAIKPFCNPVEVEVQMRSNPAPATTLGAGYSAACYALAGHIDQARAVLGKVPQGGRLEAVGIVFDVAHPVADAGDDRAAGPIMQMVVDFWPNHYMALYHAGMSEYALGQPELARKHLRSFLDNYPSDDGWRRNAIEVLGRLGVTAK